jgi:hypothetical protein
MSKQTRISHHRERIKDYLNEGQNSVSVTIRRLIESLWSYENLLVLVS